MVKPSEHPHAPQLMPLKPAVRQIVWALREQRQEGIAEFPFFLIVGAGISAPAVPLADGLVAMCQERCKAQGIPPDEWPTAITDPLERYAAWFKAAYPHRADRQRFFIKLIERAPVSPAALRLAHLLLPDAQPPLESASPGPHAPRAKPFANVVVTPNFDDLLARALRLFGADTVVCDHPRVTERIDLDRQDVLQLVHVHGSYRFYDGCNLRTEIEERARHDRDEGSESMRGLLHVLLRDRSPIVVGYSGWEGDVIMTALRQRLEHRDLARDLYWFCYRRSEADTLPKWLTDHADVRLVVPDPPPPDEGRTASGDRVTAAPRADETLAEPGTLPATRVFEELIAHLELHPPRLTDDPLGFFADHLERLLPRDHEPAARDVYAVRSVIQKVRRGVELERQERESQTQAAREAADRVKEVLDAVRRADFDAALAAARTVPIDALNDAQRLELEAALKQVYLALEGHGAALEACTMRVSLAERALASEPTLEWQVRHASALHGIGYCHGMAGQSAEALAPYDRVLTLYGDSPEPGLQERVARALVNKGVRLGTLGQAEAAISVYDEVERRFGSASEPALSERFAAALVNKGVTLGTLGQSEAAIAVYDDVERRFGSDDRPGTRAAVERAREQRKRLAEARSAVDEG